MTSQHFFYLVVAGISPADPDISRGVGGTQELLIQVPRSRCAKVAAALKLECGIGPHIAIVASDEVSRSVYFEMHRMMGTLVRHTYPADLLDENIVPKLQSGEESAASIFRDEIARVLQEAVMINRPVGNDLAVLVVTAAAKEYLMGMMAPNHIEWREVEPLDVITGIITRDGAVANLHNLGALDTPKEAVRN